MIINDRFWSRVERIPFDTCWHWTGELNEYGYGRLGSGRGKKREMAHRIAYESLVGPIPPGLTLDHLCRVHGCVNPAHLEPVSRGENVMRGQSPNVTRHHTGTCKRGHLFAGNAAFHPNGTVYYCRVCHRQQEAERRRRLKRGTP